MRIAAIVATSMLVLVAAAATPAGAATTPPKPVACKPGQARLTLGRVTSCAAPAALLPAPLAAPNELSRWVGIALDRTLGAKLIRRQPKRLRTVPGAALAAQQRRLRTQLVGTGNAMQQKLGVAAAVRRWSTLRAASIKEGPAIVTDTPTSSSFSQTLTIDDPGSQTSTSMEIGARVRKDATLETDPTLELEIGTTMTDRTKGSSKSTKLTLPLHLRPERQDRCPSATGVVVRAGRSDFKRTTLDRRPSFGVDYLNETIGMKGTVKLTGTVGRDAVLKGVAFTTTVDLDYAFAGSALGGIVKGNQTSTFKGVATGTLDPRTGAMSGGSEDVTGTLRVLSLSRRQEAAELRSQLAQVRPTLQRILAEQVAREFKGLKDAEQHWQTPNACAKADLDPAAGGVLGAGETASVTGGVKAADGTPADGDWAAQSKAKGDVGALPGSSTPAVRIPLTMTAAAADPGARSVDVTLRATSPAGVATVAWAATAPDDKVLYFRVVGATGSQTAGGTLANQNCASIGVPEGVGPWTFALQPTSGTPDGELDLESGSGAVRASGVSTRPAWTWHTCGQPSTVAKDPVVFTGRFGPSADLDVAPATPDTVTVSWDVLSPPPIFQQDLSGPDCTPLGVAGFRATVPLSTFRQRTPFTISSDTPWTVDRTFGSAHTVCSGQTTQSLTLQRVKADGSPLG